MKKLLITALLIVPFSLSTFATSENNTPSTTKTSIEVADSISAVPESVTVLRGTIANVYNNQPLPEVEITLTRQNSDFTQVVSTNAAGVFEVQGLPAGNYIVQFEKDGFESTQYNRLNVKDGDDNFFGFLLYEE